MLPQLSRCSAGIIFLLQLGSTAPAISAAESLTVELKAGRHVRENVPVVFELPKSLRSRRQFTLMRSDDKKQIPVQVEQGGRGRVVWMLDGRLDAGASRRYRLTPAADSRAVQNAASYSNDGKHLLLTVGSRPVLRYNYVVVPSPDPDKSYFRRSGYIHPLFNPSGQSLTDDFAPDHMHQHGIMFPWTNTEFEGRPLNFWDQAKQQAVVEHVKFESLSQGPVFAGFTAVIHHIDQTAPGGSKTVLEERWSVRVYVGSEGFLFELESVQQCASDSPLTIRQYHYGGLAIRGNRNWLKPGQGDFLTSDGKTRNNGNHTRPRWVEIHGLIDGKATGVTILCHPQNFRFPQPVRLHPNKPYFAFAPMVLGPFEIEPGKPYVSRYRFLAHDGKLDPKTAEQLWADYAQPATVRVLADR